MSAGSGTGEASAKDFHQAMLRSYETAKKRCNYNAGRFHQLILESGGLQAARHLLATEALHDGLVELWQCGCLDITAEALVLKPEYRHLSTEEEREHARSRLTDLGYRAME